MTSKVETGGLGPVGRVRLQEIRETTEGEAVIDLTQAEASRGLGTLAGRGRPYEEIKKEIEEYDAQLERIRGELRAEAANNVPPQQRVTVEDIGGTAIMNF